MVGVQARVKGQEIFAFGALQFFFFRSSGAARA